MKRTIMRVPILVAFAFCANHVAGYSYSNYDDQQTYSQPRYSYDDNLYDYYEYDDMLSKHPLSESSKKKSDHSIEGQRLYPTNTYRRSHEFVDYPTTQSTANQEEDYVDYTDYKASLNPRRKQQKLGYYDYDPVQNNLDTTRKSYYTDDYSATQSYSNRRRGYQDYDDYHVQQSGGHTLDYYDYKPEQESISDLWRERRRHHYPYRRRSSRKGRQMDRHEKSLRPHKKRYQKPSKIFVPVVIKKKTKKKSKILSIHKGFYAAGGTQAYGKITDLFTCKKICDLTPTCFAGDFNPWLSKCYIHSNLTACGTLRAHKAVTHFKRIPCEVLETPRGFVALGVSVINGIEIKGIKTLQDCIKKCATSGGGIASADSNIVTESQVCCHLDYDFATHTCYFHACVDTNIAQRDFCGAKLILDQAPLNSIANPTTVSITMCPRTEV